MGNDGFVGKIEEALGRILQRRKPGRKGGASGNKYGVPLIPPVVVDEEIVGGIGASTGSPEEDRNVAQAGIDHLLATLKKS